MKKAFLIVAFVLFTTPVSFSQYNMEEGYIETVSDKNAKTSFTYKNLRLYPLIAGNKFNAAHKDIGKYITLKESLEQKKIKITETESNNNSGNNINNANVSNGIQSNNIENQVNTEQNSDGVPECVAF